MGRHGARAHHDRSAVVRVFFRDMEAAQEIVPLE
jgi:hypothetical protein